MQGLLNNFLALWSLLLLLAFAGALLVFLYRVFLRKLIRMKKISTIRSKRELREAAERESFDRESSDRES
ncbi:MAG TPA: hypothetical protein VGF44_13180 [Terriglobales bacterium]|jgi:hypothetical protein